MIPFPVILSAPSGGGKTTIAKLLLERRSDVGYSVSCTTRAPRPGEVDGRDYYYLSVEEFRRRQLAGAFAEWAEVHGNLYGTLTAEIDRVARGGRHVIMDIDVQGAAQIREAFPSSVSVFILPPSGEVLLERLRHRQTESSREVVRRLRSALQELDAVDQYGYVLVNDIIDESVRRVGAIIDAETMNLVRLEGLREQVQKIAHRLEAEIDHHSA